MTMLRSATQPFDGPVLVWWPDEANKLADLRQDRHPRLIVVQEGAEPPISGDPLEEWVRSSDSASIPDRIASLVARARPLLVPSDAAPNSTASTTSAAFRQRMRRLRTRLRRLGL